VAPSRREFLLAAAGALAGARLGAPLGPPPGAPAVHVARRGRGAADLVLRGGTVFDGTGAAGAEADVVVAAGRVVRVAPRAPEAGAEEVDARGLAVAPGFVDLHSHADGTLFADPALESAVRQGVTTVVVGQDGAAAGGAAHGGSLGAFLAAVDRRRPGANVAAMVGLGGVRARVVGLADRPATAGELARMAALVERALADGARGASSGLEYAPGAFASRDELAALCRPLARRGLPYATHLRNEDDRLLEALDEALAVAEAAGCPLHVSHLKTQGPRNWGKLGAALARLDGAARGRDVTFDRYPYTAYATGLANLFPAWARDGGAAGLLARLADPDAAPRLRAAALDKVALIGGWDHVMVTGVAAAADRAAEGARLGAWAAARGADPYDACVGLLRRSRGAVDMVGFAMSEENLERLLAHPRGMVASDGAAAALAGPARRGHPHPRALGTFPRVLGRYVRERRALTLADAVHRMTLAPARRARLAGRGHLAAGAAADLVLFDPAAVADRATFEAPYQYPAGVRLVAVNGRVALRDGARADRGAGAGRALRG
jgi:N-acyl-D-amino-acid deacylase